jgi:hypothetical protein
VREKRRAGSRKKSTQKVRAPVKRKSAARAKARTRRKTAVTKSSRKKAAPRKLSSRKTGRPPTPKRTVRGVRSRVTAESTTRGLGPDAGGQSGDTEDLSRAPLADSESVEELVEEGQAFEAGVVSGVENAPDADRGGVRTRQVPEDDVPREYLDED